MYHAPWWIPTLLTVFVALPLGVAVATRIEHNTWKFWLWLSPAWKQGG